MLSYMTDAGDSYWGPGCKEKQEDGKVAQGTRRWYDSTASKQVLESTSNSINSSLLV